MFSFYFDTITLKSSNALVVMTFFVSWAHHMSLTTADQRLCFCYTDSTIPLLLKTKILTFQPTSVAVQAGLRRTWTETKIVDFQMRRLILLTHCSN